MTKGGSKMMTVDQESSGEVEIPEGFVIGVGSSAYQIEGAAYQDGKGESCMDRYLKIVPDWNEDSSNGDIACDSYNQTEVDIRLLKELGVDYYRFSLCWSRLVPNGDCKAGINRKGVEHYKIFIKRLLEEGITPMVTIFHWDTPQQLQELGGWSNVVIVDYFVDYARLVFKEYGSMVKKWYTINEPQLVGEFQYGGGFDGNAYAPAVKAPGIGDYLAAHHQLLAHAHVYDMYQKEFKPTQNGELGLTVQAFWPRPKTDTENDKKAVIRSLLFEIDSMVHPLVKGDYPPEYKAILDNKSKIEGRSKSRLPKFTNEEIQLLKGSFDFIGLNEYSTFIVSEGLSGSEFSQQRDSGIIKEACSSCKTPGVFWLAHDPESIYFCLQHLRNNYGNIPIYISENGCDDPSGIHDVHRIQYLKDYLKQVIRAKKDGCNVLGYTIWSFLDSFEWLSGYTTKFGLYEVDFKDPERKRRPKDSVQVVKNILKTRVIPP